MRTILALFLIAVPLLLYSQDNRYVIYENFRYGFIDGKGEVVIPPRFRNVGSFSQGLAPAREEAYWGFIDAQGRWAIEPQYDYASSFVDELARVYKNGQECWVDKNGVEWDSNVGSRQKADPFGMVQEEETGTTLSFNGKVLKLAPGDSPAWKRGPYIAIERTITMANWQRKVRYGVIDTSAQAVIPFGTFDKIWPFFEEQALASRYDTTTERSSYYLINTAGEIIRAIARPGSKLLTISSGPDGRLFSATYQNEAGQFCRNLLNRRGEWLLERDTMANIQPIGHGLAIVHYYNLQEYWLANEQDLCCTEAPLRKLRPFSRAANNNYLYGQDASGTWIRFDTNGIERPAPGLRALDTIEGAQLNALYSDNLATFGIRKKGEPARIGLLHTEKGLLLPPVYEKVLPQHNGKQSSSNSPTVIAVKKDGMIRYLREDGQLLWQADQLPAKKRLPYDADECVPMTYEVNCTFKMRWWLRPFVGKARFLRAWYFKWPFQKKYRGYNLYLMNDGPDTLILSARNMGQLNIHLEAQDEQGEWRRIDQCVSCDMVALNAVKRLPPGHFWAFRVPKMEGAIRTKMRYVATYSLPEEVTPPRADILPDGRQVRYPIRLKGERKLYSRIFKGGVNPAQFHPEYRLLSPGPFLREWVAER